MKFLRFPAAFLLSASFLFPAPAPRAAEQALRARVREFYQLLVDHKARAAEALVADDSKDFYYNSHKPEIESFEVGDIAWGPDHKTAQVTIVAKLKVMFPGAGPQSVEAKVPSEWKIDHGKWCWYIDQSKLATSPFGQFHPGPPGAGPPAIGGPGAGVPGGGAPGKVIPEDALHAGVKPDRNRISVATRDKNPATVTFTNSLPGPAVLHAPSVPGLRIEIAKPNLGAGESTAVRIAFEGANPPAGPLTATFTVEPTKQQIPIEVQLR